jgi:TonB family protein
MLLVVNKMQNLFLKTFLVAALSISSALLAVAQDNPAVREAVPAIYPLIALSARATGTVVVEVQIDSSGSVTSTRAISGAGVLKPVSEQSARRWKFASSETAMRKCRLTFRFIIVLDNASSVERLPIFKPPYEVEIRDSPPELEQRRDSDPPMKRKP